MRVFGEAEPLGGFLHQASPDLRVVVRRGHNSSLALSHQRAGSSTVQYCTRGRHWPHVTTSGPWARSVRTGELRQAGTGRRSEASLSATSYGTT